MSDWTTEAWLLFWILCAVSVLVGMVAGKR